jgi:hypothetical protein
MYLGADFHKSKLLKFVLSNEMLMFETQVESDKTDMAKCGEHERSMRYIILLLEKLRRTAEFYFRLFWSEPKLISK